MMPQDVPSPCKNAFSTMQKEFVGGILLPRLVQNGHPPSMSHDEEDG